MQNIKAEHDEEIRNLKAEHYQQMHKLNVEHDEKLDAVIKGIERMNAQWRTESEAMVRGLKSARMLLCQEEGGEVGTPAPAFGEVLFICQIFIHKN